MKVLKPNVNLRSTVTPRQDIGYPVHCTTTLGRRFFGDGEANQDFIEPRGCAKSSPAHIHRSSVYDTECSVEVSLPLIVSDTVLTLSLVQEPGDEAN